MVFSSYNFLFLFLGFVLVVYYVLHLLVPRAAGAALKTGWLIFVSYVFYGWERYDYVGLILFSTLVDFFCARAIAGTGDDRRRRRLLVVSIATNLTLLGFFKYFNFFADTLGVGSPWPGLVLPVGISFYTFQSMSYTIDVYRRVVAPSPRFAPFMAYVALFPQLVAGPIVRYRDIADQLVERRHTLDKAARGSFRFMIGFAKKTLIANNVGILANALPGVDAPGLLDAWVGVLAYAFQIYFDFSGYSDMAIGLGLMLGFRFPENFDGPYRSESITEFWRRWHISLSSWLRDYLYVPLGGNRLGRWKTYRNLMLTMLLGGLWHGAGWTFVLWGAWHGALLALERMLGRRPLYHALPRVVRVALTFLLVMVGWIFFRAESFEQGADILMGFLGRRGLGELTLRAPYPVTLPASMLAVAAGLAFFAPTTARLAERITRGRAVFAVVVFVVGVGQMLLQGFNPFLYFRF